MSWYATKKASKLPLMDKSKILVFDTETTGLEPTIDEILQISILDGYGVTLFHSYIRPQRRKSWKAAERINHISYEMVENAPVFRSVRNEIQELFNHATLVVGYNVNFDINFVKAAGIIVSGQVFDVMTAFASYRADVDRVFYRKCRLKECAEYFGHSYCPHDSLNDAKATLACFNSLISDVRFTTYKTGERATIEKDISAQKHTKLTVQFAARKRKSAIFYGLILIFISEIIIYLSSDLALLSMSEYFKSLEDAIIKWPMCKIELTACVLLAAGCVMTVVGIVKFIIRLPKFIVAKIKHLLGRFL